MTEEYIPAKATPRRIKREQVLFAAYFCMSPRSLDLLHKALNASGDKIGFRTLADYSSAFHWQDRCKELDAQFKETREQRLIDSVAAMNARQMRLGQSMQTVGDTALKLLQGSKLSANEIASLVKHGVQIERLAAGVATSRQEIVRTMRDEVVRELAVVFTRVNALPDPNERTRQFALAADKVMESFMIQESNAG